MPITCEFSTNAARIAEDAARNGQTFATAILAAAAVGIRLTAEIQSEMARAYNRAKTATQTKT